MCPVHGLIPTRFCAPCDGMSGCDQLRGKLVINFWDNDGILHSMKNGGAAPEDVHMVIGKLWLKMGPMQVGPAPTARRQPAQRPTVAATNRRSNQPSQQQSCLGGQACKQAWHHLGAHTWKEQCLQRSDTEPFRIDELRGCLATGTKGLPPKCLIHDRDTCVTCEQCRQWRRLM